MEALSRDADASTASQLCSHADAVFAVVHDVLAKPRDENKTLQLALTVRTDTASPYMFTRPWAE